MAEETGLIVQLGDWVIREACRQLRSWTEQGLGHLTIAVNVSIQQFSREDFLESVLSELRHVSVKPQQLELEITESLLMRNVDDTTACMKRFRAAGMSLSIDDFGTGYSSLGYLRQFPVNALKIDRSFVEELHTNDDDAAICAAIIAMARELELKVIAEGVENEEQLRFLREHRCDQRAGKRARRCDDAHRSAAVARIASSVMCAQRSHVNGAACAGPRAPSARAASGSWTRASSAAVHTSTLSGS